MLVYGIRCAPADLTGLPATAQADYYMDYGLLVFPEYTKGTCVESHGRLTPAFWSEVKRVVENPTRPHSVCLEHPYITDGENDVVHALRSSYPSLQTDWYYVPRAVVHAESDNVSDDAAEDEVDSDTPAIRVSDLS